MEFIAFELSKKLKEKGFSQRPDYFNYSSYYEWDGLRKIHSLSNASVWFDPNISRDNIYFAPTISQVLKWLREEKEIYVSILPFATHSTINKVAFYYLIEYNSTGETMEGIEQNTYCAEWKDAALAGIEYVLNNLI